MSLPTYLIIAIISLFATFAHALETQICQKSNRSLILHGIGIGPDATFSSFIERHKVWVDRSLLIKTLLEEHEKNIFFITAPTSWCKSSNLAMLQSFFSVHVDPEYKKYPMKEKFAYNYFVKGKIHEEDGTIQHIFPIPMISQHPDIIEKNLNQFFVIYLNFYMVPFDKELKFFQTELKEAFREHEYAINRTINNNTVSAELKNRAKTCQLIYHSEKEKIPVEDLLQSVQTLSEILYTQYGKKSVILLDEFDQFIRDIYFDWDNDLENETSVLEFYKKFTHYTIHSNKYLEKAIITSVLSVGPIMGINEAKNVREYRFINGDRIYQFFGFTSINVFEMMKLHDVTNLKPEEVVKWYGGYNCPNAPSGFIFSPSSVTWCITKKRAVDYMIISEAYEFILVFRRFPIFKRIQFTLLNEGSYDVEYSKIQKLDQRCRFMHTVAKNKTLLEKDFNKEHCDIALGFLCDLGYVTVDRTFANSGRNATHIRLKAPNEEVMFELEDKYTLYPSIPPPEEIRY